MLRLWSYDLAREQCPTVEHLFALAETTREGGYDGLGLYLEHRFAYPSAPWAAGEGALKPAMVRRLRAEYPSVQVIPMLNLLGHMEGFLRCREGERFSEEPGRGLQACPSHPEFAAFARGLLEDALDAFDDEIVHLGGDETAALGKCPRCRETSPADLYAAHFAPLCKRVLAGGRRPALWGDMLLAHPQIAERLPKETLIFDWQYFGGVEESAPRLRAMGFDVVACPTLHAYNAAWLHLQESVENVERVAADAHRLGLAGLCLTTWEMGLLGAYDALFPAIRWAGEVFRDPPKRPSERDRLRSAAARRGLEFLDGDRLSQEIDIRSDATASIAEEYCTLPLRSRGRRNLHATGDPDNTDAAEILSCGGSRVIEFAIAEPKEIRRALSGYAASKTADRRHRWAIVLGLEWPKHEAPIAKLAAAIFKAAVADQTSSIRVADDAVSFHLDGREEEFMDIPPNLILPLIDRLKVLAAWTIADQDEAGERPFTLEIDGRRFYANLSLPRPRVAVVRFGLPRAEPDGVVAAFGESQEWARLVGVELSMLGSPFSATDHRSKLRVRFLLQGDPFLAWRHHREALTGPIGEKAHDIAERALRAAQDEAQQGVAILVRGMVEFVRLAEEAAREYDAGRPEAAIAKLASTRMIFDRLSQVARRTRERIGGSQADVERCRIAREQVERVMVRIRRHGDGSLGYTPSFSQITEPRFTPHDQGAWWQVNDWA